MIVTAWNNGQHHSSGAGYGLRLATIDRDRFFRKDWQSVILELEDQLEQVEISISKTSFWKTCRELISIEVGRWMLQNKLAPWPRNHPPKLRLEPIGERRFRLYQSV